MNITRRKATGGDGTARYLAANPLAAVNSQKLKNFGSLMMTTTLRCCMTHGQVWNRDLPGVAGQLRLAFDFRVNLETGAGFGAAGNPVFSDWNVHFSIDSTERKKLRSNESRYTMTGVVTQAQNPALVGHR